MKVSATLAPSAPALPSVLAAKLLAPVLVPAMVLALASAGAGCGLGDESLDGALDAGQGEAGGVGGAADTGRGGAKAALEVADPEPIRPVVEIPDEWNSEIEAVYGRYWLYWDAFAAAHGPPGADPTYGPLQELSTPTNWASLQEQLNSFARDGLVLELPEASITEHLLRLPDAAVLTGDEGEEVILQDCWIDDFVQRTLDGRVVAEAREAKLMNVVMRVQGGQWRVDGVSAAPSLSDGVEQCAELIS